MDNVVQDFTVAMPEKSTPKIEGVRTLLRHMKTEADAEGMFHGSAHADWRYDDANVNRDHCLDSRRQRLGWLHVHLQKIELGLMIVMTRSAPVSNVIAG